MPIKVLQQRLGIVFDYESRKLTEAGTDYLLVFAVFSSWFLFPVMLKFLAYTEFQVSVFIISITIFVTLARYSKLNKLEWSTWHKWFISFWAVYLLFLLLASVRSGELYGLKQYCIILYKVTFFAILLFYMKKNFVVWSFRLYSSFMVLVVVLACIVSVGVALDIMHPIQYLTEKVKEHEQYFSVYWGGYYYLSLHRMQGFAEEPGTFALTILPAFYWLLVVVHFYFRAFIIAGGIFLSYSTGALWAFILLLPTQVRGNIFSRKKLVVLLLTIFLVSLVFASRYVKLILLGDFPSLFAELEWFISSSGRLHSLLLVTEYLLMHPFGTGTALGMKTVDYPISVGYANAMLESGIIGGVAYCAMFGLLGWQALKLSLSVDMIRYEGRVRFVVAIAVMIVLFMGLQRQQPDLSLWHMWIYASFFYLTMKKEKVTTEIDEVEGQGQRH